MAKNNESPIRGEVA